MPRSHGLVWCCAGWLLVGCVDLAAAEETPRAAIAPTVPANEKPAQEARRLADEAKFSEVETQLKTLAQTHKADDLRFATVLYATQQAYAAGRRDLAEKWLHSIEHDIPAKLKLAVADAFLWVRCDPLDLKQPTPLLLEQATNHARSSLGAVALLQRADWLAEQERPDEALWVYHELARLFPAPRFAAPAMLKAAKLHTQLGQTKETVEWTQRLIKQCEVSPEAPAALYLLAGAATKLGDDTQANAALTTLVAKHKECIYWPDAVYRLAEQEFKTSHAESFLDNLAAALNHPSMTAPLRARCYFLQAQSAITKRNWTAADDALTRVIALKPEASLQHLAAFWQAEVTYQRGDTKLAEERFQALASLGTAGNEDWLGMVPLRQAQLAVKQQDWQTALERLDHLTQAFPKFNRQQEADYLRARALLGLARFREAREVLEKIIAAKTTTPTETAAMAQWMIGESFFLQRQYADALAAYDRTLTYDKFPNWQAAALLQSAKCCEQLKRKDEAVTRYHRVVDEFSTTQYAAEAKRRLSGDKPRASVAQVPREKESTGKASGTQKVAEQQPVNQSNR